MTLVWTSCGLRPAMLAFPFTITLCPLCWIRLPGSHVYLVYFLTFKQHIVQQLSEKGEKIFRPCMSEHVFIIFSWFLGGSVW